jgi:hypothetical protein
MDITKQSCLNMATLISEGKITISKSLILKNKKHENYH